VRLTAIGMCTQELYCRTGYVAGLVYSRLGSPGAQTAPGIEAKVTDLTLGRTSFWLPSERSLATRDIR